MVEAGPIFQMGRYDGKIIEFMDDSDIGKLELNKETFFFVP